MAKHTDETSEVLEARLTRLRGEVNDALDTKADSQDASSKKELSAAQVRADPSHAITR